MEKEFVPYEQALALKELGFNEVCFGYCLSSFKKDVIKQSINGCINSALESHEVTLPIYQQVFRWFRDKYNLHSWVTSKTLDNGKSIYIPHGRTIPDTIKNNLIVDIIPYQTHKTHEEAEFTVINKLIEIIKNKENGKN